MTAIQLQNRGEIRRSVGRNLGIVLIGVITSGGVDKTSVIDTVNLTGGDDEHNGKQLMIYDATGSIVDGETVRVTDYDGSSSDATVTTFTQNTTALDKYEMWDTPWLIADINDAINQAIINVTRDVLKLKQTTDTFTRPSNFEYDCLTSYKGLHKVEYCTGIELDHLLDDCETAWTAGSANVTATADSAFEREGTYCAKLVEDGNSAAGAILGYATISSTDISDCDRVEFDMYSSIALTAGYLDFVLSASAAIAATTESIDIPAMTAGKWYRHSLTLANPHSDTAIISLGVVNTTDVGACTLYFDNIHAVKDGSKIFKPLTPQYWGVAKGSTNYLKLTTDGKALVGNTTQLRLTGYQLPDIFSDDTTDCDIDPAYVIAQTTGWLAISHAKSSRLQIKDRQNFAKYWLGLAESMKPSLSDPMMPDTIMF
uniref:Uncharacterized protein n=1 Tax=viral metagenome TaxID=1070528 RepID=A0A6M3KEK5_9ZZZZ